MFPYLKILTALLAFFFLIPSWNFHPFFTLSIISCTLFLFLLEPLSILIIVVSNSLSDYSNILAMSQSCSGCLICVFKLWVFSLLLCLVIFCWKPDMRYCLKGTLVSRLLMMWRWNGGGEACYNPVILSPLMSLWTSELLLGLTLQLLNWMECIEWTGVGYVLYLSLVGFGKTPAG